jgi:hypothetical protein
MPLLTPQTGWRLYGDANQNVGQGNTTLQTSSIVAVFVPKTNQQKSV